MALGLFYALVYHGYYSSFNGVLFQKKEMDLG